MQPSAPYSRPFSYVDTACAFAYFNLVPTDLGRLRDEIEAALQDRQNRESFSRHLSQIALKVLVTDFRGTYYHEWHHCLQAIFYPYYYLQSWRELSIALNILADLRHSSQTATLGQISLPPESYETITHTSMVYGIEIEHGMLKLVPRELADLRPSDITLTDLIEDATSIFQFKVENASEGSGTAYRQWIRGRRSVYSNVFTLLSKLMGVDAAYVALPPLVQLSFATTGPVTAFLSLVNYTLRTHTPPEVLGCDLYYKALRSRCAATFTGKDPDPNSPTSSDELTFMDLETYRRLVANTPNHTVYPLALRYLDLVSTDPSVENSLFHPYRPDVQTLLNEYFLPPITVIRLYYELLQARDTLLIVNPWLVSQPWPQIPDITYSDYLREVMKRKDLAYSLFSDINNYLEHNCHHAECPYYPTNVCRRWSAVPKDWAQCPFPAWFATITGRSIDVTSGELRRITDRNGG